MFQFSHPLCIDVHRRLQLGALLGNFPQAFTHLAIINAAAHIERAAENRGPLDPVH